MQGQQAQGWWRRSGAGGGGAVCPASLCLNVRVHTLHVRPEVGVSTSLLLFTVCFFGLFLGEMPKVAPDPSLTHPLFKKPTFTAGRTCRSTPARNPQNGTSSQKKRCGSMGRGQRGGGGKSLEKETKRVQNTKLADTGHNLISTVRGGTAAQCNLPWQPIHTSMAGLTRQAKLELQPSPFPREGGADRATVYGPVLKKHTPSHLLLMTPPGPLTHTHIQSSGIPHCLEST